MKTRLMNDENRLRPDWQPESSEDVRTHQGHRGRVIRVLTAVPKAIPVYLRLNIRGHVPISMAV